MKKSELTPDQIMRWVEQIRKNPTSSMSVVYDTKGNAYGVKMVTESVSVSLASLENGNVLLASNAPYPGVRTIDKVQLKRGIFQVVTDARMLCDTTQALKTDVALSTLLFASTATAAVKNLEARFMQGGELFRTPGNDLMNSKTATSNDDDFRSLLPFIIRGGEDFNINLKLPAGAVITDTCVQIQWRAIEFTAPGGL